jgi:hypothetical protein
MVKTAGSGSVGGSQGGGGPGSLSIQQSIGNDGPL